MEREKRGSRADVYSEAFEEPSKRRLVERRCPRPKRRRLGRRVSGSRNMQGSLNTYVRKEDVEPARFFQSTLAEALHGRFVGNVNLHKRDLSSILARIASE